MTAVLSPSDPLRKDRRISIDDNAVDYSPSKSSDWREKYNEVVDMLAEARHELEDFRRTSEELEAELEAELTRTEKAHEDLKAKVARAELERDDWKTKFMTLQTTHNTTTTSLQRELDKLRQEYQATKVILRELEMGNDNLERNERAVSSSLAEMEAKYSRILEEKILLEQELLEKATLEEETQRLKDELRESSVEVTILRDQVAALTARDDTSSRPASVHTSAPSVASTDDLLTTPPPADLDVAEVSPASENLGSDHNTTPKASLSKPPINTPLLRASRQGKPSPMTVALKNNSMVRSTTLPSFGSPTTTASPRSLIRPPVARAVSTATNLTTGSLAKNKGVQMVSEMRARFQTLEQKIHTRVPRLRMGSITNRVNNAPTTPVSTSPSVRSSASTAKTSWESQRKSIDSRKSQDLDRTTNGKESDSSGWVLIMEDSPSPRKDRDRIREKRRLSSGPAPTSFKLTASSARATSPSQSTPMHSNPLSVSTGLRRPQSRLSGGGSSASSRPQTPTFLPVPSTSFYSSASASTLKKSTGPNTMKRSSYGQSKVEPVPPLPDKYRERPITMPPSYRSSPGTTPTTETKRTLPDFSDLQNVTLRAKPTFSTASILSKSRIGRPSGGSSGRKSAGEPIPALDISDLRPRSGCSDAD